MWSNVYVCRTCGLARGTPADCPMCEQPLDELSPLKAHEFRNNPVLQSTVNQLEPQY
jgi:hypothetical protein